MTPTKMTTSNITTGFNLGLFNTLLGMYDSLPKGHKNQKLAYLAAKSELAKLDASHVLIFDQDFGGSFSLEKTDNVPYHDFETDRFQCYGKPSDNAEEIIFRISCNNNPLEKLRGGSYYIGK